MSTDRVSATLRIAASAGELFRIVSDPAGQVAIDGSGTLVAAPDAAPLTTVGQTFDMDMDREPLGDIPDLKKYQVRNTVTAFVDEHLVEWTVGFGDHPPFGHVYGWQLDLAGDHETDVTNYCDWTNIAEEMRSAVSFLSFPSGCWTDHSRTSTEWPPDGRPPEPTRRLWATGACRRDRSCR